MAVQTPASIGSATFLRRRKCLVDDYCVLNSSVIRGNLANTSGLKRSRTNVPLAPLHVRKVQKVSNLPVSVFEPLIPYSSALGSVFSIKNILNVQASGGSPVIHQSPDRDVILLEAPNHGTLDIPPSTPATFTSSMFFDGPSDSQEEESNENTEFDNEDINSSAGESWKMEKWSVRTKAAARCLCSNLISKKKQKESEEVKLVEILQGKKKGESARLFYEILVLKSGGYVDVHQEEPFDDITVAGTSKLEKFQ